MNVLLKGREVTFYLQDPGAKLAVRLARLRRGRRGRAPPQAGTELILVKPGRVRAARRSRTSPSARSPSASDDDTAVILYTSGTTGKPKGAELTHANLLRNCRVIAGFAEFGAGEVLLGALPLFHSFGQTCTMNGAVCSGATVTMLPRFDPEKALEIIERDRVTVFQGVPTMYNAMLHAERADSTDASCLRLCMSGGAAIPVELIRAFEEKFGCAILEGYGLSETSPVASFNQPDKQRKAGSIGTPIEGVEMQVWDDDGNEVAQGEVGEIVIRGHNVMKGYWDRPEATGEAIDADGWFTVRRHGQGRRGRLLLHRRPQEGPDHPRRLQRLPARDRGGALRAPGRAGGGRGRRCPTRRSARRSARRWSSARASRSTPTS